MTTQRPRSALVTGSSGGLGLAVAESLAAAGFNIVVHGLEAAAAVQPAMAALAARHGIGAEFAIAPPASCFVLGNVFAHHAPVSL
jgi:3-hydroxybutyrate dehydrogenase